MRSLAAVALGSLLWVAATPAAAEEGSDSWDDHWHFQVSPYLWMAGLEGDVAPISGLPKAEVDASFSDILDNLDLSFMLQAEARHDRFGVFTDFVYLELSADEGTGGPFFSEVDVETDTFFATASAFYRLVAEERLAVDLLAGARVWYVDTELEFKPGLLAGRKVDDDDTWVDPVFGVRGGFQVLGPLGVSAGADIGGFGAASDLTWQLVGTVDFVPWEWMAIRAGYRHLEVDYDHGGFVWDVALSGPILGVSLRF